MSPAAAVRVTFFGGSSAANCSFLPCPTSAEYTASACAVRLGLHNFHPARRQRAVVQERVAKREVEKVFSGSLKLRLNVGGGIGRHRVSLGRSEYYRLRQQGGRVQLRGAPRLGSIALIACDRFSLVLKNRSSRRSADGRGVVDARSNPFK